MIKIVFFGNTKYSVFGAQIVHEVFPFSLIVTISDRVIGRDKQLLPSPVKKWAVENNIKILETDELNEDNIKKIAKIEPDFLVVEDYRLILPGNLLALPKFAPLNIHHSLLPKYKGPSPAPTAILNGDKISGVTIIKMTEKVDAGDILAQKEYALKSDETTESLLMELNIMGGKLMVEVIKQYLEGKAKPYVQNHAYASFCTLIKRQDGYFDINNPPSKEILDRMIRAYYPWPNVWSRWKGKVVKFYPGNLVQMEGKNKVKLADFLNGYPDFPIKNL